MNITNQLYFTEGKDWRKWLAKNHAKEKEAWLVFYRKSSGKERLSYNTSVEEALCYGWIDSTLKRIDDEKFAQRFTPRRKNSVLSEMNKERIRRLIKAKRMTAFGLKAVAHAFDHQKDKKEKLFIANDILKVLKADKEAWKNFQNFSEGYKKVRIGFIEGRRRHGDEFFQKSLQYFVKMTAKNKKFGMLR